ncbi:MAG: tandem-95 repeat protein, partial [Desulfobacterales bacterium]|nr:tandem-95 repeat protein [Desulfobacterales bacterium]
MGCTSTGGTIPRTARSFNDILVKTTVYALCIALVFMLLVGVGSADNNAAPVANDDTDTTSEDTSVKTEVLSNDFDPEGDTIIVTEVTNPANGAVVINVDYTVTYTPNADFNGDDSYTYTISDGNSGTDTATVTISVGASNDAPILDYIGNQAVNENTTLSFTVSATDEDAGDTLTYSAVGLPTGANLNSSSRVFTWTPTFDQAGTYSVQFNVTDGTEIDSEIVTITVNNVNIAPILDSIPDTHINETETATIVLGTSDPDSDIITYSTNATFGNLTNNTFTWTSEYDDDGIYYLEFTVSDGDLTDTEIGVIVVGDVDRTPVLERVGSKSVNKNTELSFTLNATDPDGDTLIYSAIGLPTDATLNSSNGLFKWIPSDTQAGTYHVIFQVTDKLLQDSETVKITVDGVNTLITLTGFG